MEVLEESEPRVAMEFVTQMLTLEFLFWLSSGLVVYTYLVYPLVLVVLAAMKQTSVDVRYGLGRQERRRNDNHNEPRVSFLFAAHNEAEVIVDKLANCSQIEYASHRLEVLVGCDGCSDQTVSLARRHAADNVTVLAFEARRGKPAVLNDLVASAQGDILVFSDANTMYEASAVRSLVRHFRDPAVGCVCGELVLVHPEGDRNTEGIYWRYEVFLKFFESRLNMLVGVNGGVFAIRRELFVPLSSTAIVDDFLVGMQVRRKGYRVLYDPEARASEKAPLTVEDEFRRRVRIGAGNFHALVQTWPMLLPTAGSVAFSYWSHKLLRWLIPFALLSILGTSLVLSTRPFYAACLGGLSLLALAALLGSGWGPARRRGRLPAAAYYFFSMNLALLFGFFKFITGTQRLAWHRTSRETSR